MGQAGTEVAREAADLVLLDDNFATIVNAVREGRRVYDNIRKFLRYVLTGNAGEIWTLFLAPFFGLPLPLLPVQILWVNLVTDGLPGLAFVAEPEEPGVMRRPPRPPDESVFAGGIWQHVLWVGLLIGGVSLATMVWSLGNRDGHWRTATFTTLALAQLAHALAIRSEREPAWRTLGANLPLLGSVALTVGLQAAIIYHPVLQKVFKTSPLQLRDWGVCLAAAALVFAAVEVEKWLRRRGAAPGIHAHGTSRTAAP
jgi:Ca2+-transporting ATPase